MMNNCKEGLIVDFSDLKKVLNDLNDLAEKKKKNKSSEKQQPVKLSKDQFVYLIGFIKSLEEMVGDTEKKISQIFESDFFGQLKINSIITELIDWVGKQVGDENNDIYGSTLEWYFYECKDMEEKHQCITFTEPTEKKMYIRNAEELYDFFVENAKR